MKKRILNSLTIFSFIFLSIIYLEILFKIRVLRFDFDANLLRAMIFSFSYSVLMMFFIMFFKAKTVKRVVFTLTVILIFLYINQEIYHSFIKGFYSITVAGDLTLGLSFLNKYFASFRFWHLFYIVPFLSLFLLNRYKFLNFDIEYCTLKQPLIVLMLGSLTFFLSLQTIDENVDGSTEFINYSDMDLYTYMYNPQDALKKFGLLTYTQRDFFSLFRVDQLSEQEYKMLLDAFFEDRAIPAKVDNAYTGEFAGKNFILIMAESLDTFAINEQLTPKLYELKEQNAYFENFYSPLYYRSTADSEFMVQTALYPDKNVTLSMEAYIENTFPNTMPKLFSEIGYLTYSFHNYTDYFYPRTEFHTIALGYDGYYGSDALGLLDNPAENVTIFNHDWQSDLEMMEVSIPYFINSSENFFVNYLTVSGHFKYAADHEIAKLNVHLVNDYEEANDITLPEEIKYYLAANIELDKALVYLFDALETAGKLDNTVVMIFGDHYAYGVDKRTIWDYEAGLEEAGILGDSIKDYGSDMDLHNVPMIVYSDSDLLTGTVYNYMSTIDVMPTIANLFDLNFAYEYAFGIDALQNDSNIVNFADMSFISNNFSYDSLSEDSTMTPGFIDDEEEAKAFLLEEYNLIINDYIYNSLVLKYDYFKEEEEEPTE